MQRTILLSLPLLALAGCEAATEPLAPDGDIRQFLASTEGGAHVATVLPDGMLSGRTFLVGADNGGIFGSVVQGSGR